jgi:hypothetical protein
MQPHSLIVVIGRTRWTLTSMAEMRGKGNRKNDWLEDADCGKASGLSEFNSLGRKLLKKWKQPKQ